ncbi:hypothetical protein M413DRAFT_389085 [Hebeloma cylindrosporum]|uniref:F-box domain-containing protein n=1 Tax=Hebeloma cylindrosporum TaxID=76867 RepID=A0A0C3CI45_HEBCY|nr:hypothetical protein M413DRAFT_389085 [Hebeloma cylindrosporum h7]
MLARFPHELLELFVDEVAANTNRAQRASALKSCSLASPCISKRARSHLFSTVSLRWTSKRGLTIGMKERSLLLKQLMDSDRILITFIHVLELYINDCTDEGVQEEYGLPAIITALYSSPRSRLHSFSLSAFKFRFTPWDALPTAFKAALSNLCQSGSLKSLSLIHLQGIPLRLISKCHRNLQRFTVFYTSFQNSIFPPLETGRTCLCCLEELHTDSSIVFLGRALEAAHNGALLSGLRRLHGVVRHPSDAEGYWETMQDSSSSLRDLRLFLRPKLTDDTLQCIQIGRLACLHSLSFHISCSPHDGWIDATRIFSFLRSSHSNSLNHISIDILVYMASANPNYFFHAETGWDALDAAIASSSFPSLESVNIRLISPGLMTGPDLGVVDENRELEVRDISHLSMASFLRTAERGCEGPTPMIGVKLLMPDCTQM